VIPALPVRLAFISDIHGNLEALRAVAPLIGGIPTYCCGDVVGYGANPNEVVEWVRQNCAGCVMGNHDQAVVTGETGWFNAAAAEAIRWTKKRMSEANLRYLASLPTSFRFQPEGKRFLIVHGSPEDPLHEYVRTATHQDLFEHYLVKHEADVLALGHTHHPFEAKTSRGTVFNPGSVGQPRHGTPGAFFAIVELEGGAVNVKLLMATYDISSAASKIYAAGLPRALGDRLYEGL
jgi:putative phosphoesterase